MPGILEQRLSNNGGTGQKNRHKNDKEKKSNEKAKNRNIEPEDEFEDDSAEEDGFDDDEMDEDEKTDNSILTEEDIQQLEELDDMMSEENFRLESKRKKTAKRIAAVFLTAACCYLVVLIYGSFITEFQYDDNGKVVPVILSVSDISDRNEYTTIMGLYIQTRSLYEVLLTLDYRMAAGQEDTMAIAPEYESALDTVSALTTQIDAAVINTKYTQVKNMLLTWVQTHAAAYCQYMSAAITQNDSDSAAEAIAARQVLSDNFSLITQNIVTLGETIKGYDLTDIKDWSPDGFVAETIEGVDADASDNAAYSTPSETTEGETETDAAENETEIAAAVTEETTADSTGGSLQDAQSQVLDGMGGD